MDEEVTQDIAALNAMVSYQLPDTEAYTPSDIGLSVDFNAVYVPPEPEPTPEPEPEPIVIPDGTVWKSLIAANMVQASNAQSFGYALNAFWQLSPTATSTPNKRVMRTVDGESWAEITNTAAYETRSSNSPFVESNGYMILIGGDNAGLGSYSSVYKSSNGYDWTFVSSGVPTSRTQHAACIHNNKIFISGGYLGGSDLSSVYSSSDDGLTWNLETATPGWSARKWHAMVSFLGKLWVFGGTSIGSIFYNDIWSSVDGASWTQESTGAAWSKRYAFGCCVFNNAIWILCGSLASGQTKELWKTFDGVNWILVSSDVGISSRQSICLVAANNTMYAFGGGGFVDMYKAI